MMVGKMTVELTKTIPISKEVLTRVSASKPRLESVTRRVSPPACLLKKSNETSLGLIWQASR